jgi:hypothetical protein
MCSISRDPCLETRPPCALELVRNFSDREQRNRSSATRTIDQGQIVAQVRCGRNTIVPRPHGQGSPSLTRLPRPWPDRAVRPLVCGGEDGRLSTRQPWIQALNPTPPGSSLTANAASPPAPGGESVAGLVRHGLDPSWATLVRTSAGPVPSFRGLLADSRSGASSNSAFDPGNGQAGQELQQNLAQLRRLIRRTRGHVACAEPGRMLKRYP